MGTAIQRRTKAEDHPLRPQERPRERMMLYGREVLSDVELLALVLGGGRSVPRASLLLEGFGGLLGLDRACAQELRETPGVGEASATAICAAFELSSRAAQLRLPFDEPVRVPEDIARFARERLGHSVSETFVVVGLDARARVRLVRTVAVGSLSSVEVHPREVFRPLVRAGMHSAIVIHNHPSGEPTPSDADVELTHRLVDAGRLVGIPVVDHVVVARNGSVSLAQLGLLPV